MSRNKRKAFTLTELLVVVVVIGVLAAVVLPKYTKVIETRKTTEAENMMAAVRTEQERRCALDKPYIGNVNKLVTAQILPSENTKNFNYSLQSQGMMAASLGKYNYTLQMPSYTDGRLCCGGADCNKLNKEYPTCEELIAKVDYQAATKCEADDTDPVSLDCVGSKPSEREVCSSCGGTHSRTVTCNHENGQWQTGEWSACSITDEECNSCEYKVGNDQDKNTEYLRCIDPDYYRYEGSWNESTCSCDCPPGTHKVDGYCVEICDVEKRENCELKAGGGDVEGKWDESTCSCTCPDGSTWSETEGCMFRCEWLVQFDQRKREEKEACTDGGKDSNWNMDTCSCDCGPNGAMLKSICTNDQLTADEAEFLHDRENHPFWGPDLTHLQDRNYDHVPGIWDAAHCRCRCQTWNGVEKITYEEQDIACVTRNCEKFNSLPDKAQAIKVCNNGLVFRGNVLGVAGRWDPDRCHCNCPAGTYLKYYNAYPVLCAPIPGRDVDYEHYYDTWDDGIDIEDVPEYELYYVEGDYDGGDYDGDDDGGHWDRDYDY